MTRNKLAILEGIKNNQKIDKNKVQKPKKQIPIPPIINQEEKYYEMIKVKKEQYSTLRQSNIGFIRYFDIQDKYPLAEEYEADERDIVFLRELFPSKLPPEMSQEDITNNDLVREFERVIIYLEKTEDQSFVSFQKKVQDFSLEVLEQICGHWIKKCKLFKRPLLRENWKEILVKDKYGPYNKLLKAFHPRTSEEKKHSRNLNRMNKAIQKQILHDLLKENKQSLSIQNMVLLREKYKLMQMKCFLEPNVTNLNRFFEKIQKKKEILFKTTQKHFDERKPPEPVPEQPVIVAPPKAISEPKSVQFLIASTVKYLKKYSFKLREFTAGNIDILNSKINELTAMPQSKEQNSERKVDIRKPEKPWVPPQNLFLVKRYAIHDHAVFLDKVQTNSLMEKQKNYFLENFEDQHRTLNRFSHYQDKFNHLLVRTQSSINPLTYCGDFQLSQCDELMEKLRLRVNSNL